MGEEFNKRGEREKERQGMRLICCKKSEDDTQDDT